MSSMSTTTINTSVLDHLDSVAVIAAGLFAGTALYMTVGEVPALRAFGLDEHWRFFPYMYEKASLSQGLAAGIAGIGGVVHGTRIIGAPYYRNLWIAAGSVFIGLFPYTLICLAPTNNFIINDNKRITSGNEIQVDLTKKKELLDQWAGLHLVRTVSSLVGFGAMVFGLSRHSSLVLRW